MYFTTDIECPICNTVHKNVLENKQFTCKTCGAKISYYVKEKKAYVNVTPNEESYYYKQYQKNQSRNNNKMTGQQLLDDGLNILSDVTKVIGTAFGSYNKNSKNKTEKQKLSKKAKNKINISLGIATVLIIIGCYFLFVNEEIEYGNRIIIAVFTIAIPCFCSWLYNRSVRKKDIKKEVTETKKIDYESLMENNLNQTKEQVVNNSFCNAAVKSKGNYVPANKYNEVLAYFRFFNKYKYIKSSNFLKENDYPWTAFAGTGVDSIHSLHKELETKGFYLPANVTDTLNCFKLPEIRNVASKLNIQVKGNKESIIKTIAENANIDEVNGILNCFVVSRQELKANEYKKRHLVEYEFYNREISGISLAEFKEMVAEYSLEEVTSYFDLNDSDLSFDQYIKKRENFSVADLQWQKLQKKLKNSKEDFGRDVYYEMAEFLYSEDKNKDALIMFLRVLYLDLSGANIYKAWQFYLGSDKENIEDRKECVVTCLTSTLFDRILELKEYFDGNMFNEIYSIKLPIHACSNKKYEEIVNDTMNGAVDYTYIRKLEKTIDNSLKTIAETFV